MINSARGEVGLVLNGQSHCLCLTLGALAEIEGLDRALGPEDRIYAMLEILWRAGGGRPSAMDLETARGAPADVIRAVLACFKGVR